MDKIYVTKTFLPPFKEYNGYLRQIWQSGQITNQGPLLRRFESESEKYLGVKRLHFVTNGTIALQVALRALSITEGEVITTPFSYVATTSTILWERCQPIFVDINPRTFCIDADKLESAITKKTKAIMAVHVFGNPCEVKKIETIAKKHNIKVIYDAAHAFATRFEGRSLLDYGDISTCSFHATKLFHTIEGGAVVTKNTALLKKIELIKRFGHDADNHFMLGINAKASEFQAAMGLCNLNYIDEIIKKRKQIALHYDGKLSKKLQKISIAEGTEYNYAYYPVVMNSEKNLLETINELNSQSIFPRRYFFPSLNTLPYIKKRYECPISEDISRRIMCLPMYVGLNKRSIEKICEIVNKNAESNF